MFCPNCGNPDQAPETYCRSCGTYLHDPSKPFKKERPPEEHLKANSVLIALSALSSLLLAAWLYSFLLRDYDVPPAVNYIVAGLLTANFAWQVQTFIRTLMLRSRIKKWGKLNDVRKQTTELGASVPKSLRTADLSDAVPASVTEHTTRHLVERGKRSS